MKLNERIRVLTKMFGGTQVEFAKRIGTSQSTVTSWISRGSIPASALKRIAEACPNVDMNWLVTGEGYMLKEVAPTMIYSQWAVDFDGLATNVEYTKGTKDVTIRIQ